MAFKPLIKDDGKTVEIPATNSKTFTKGAACKMTSGLLDNATAGQGTDVRFIAMETVTTTASGQLVLCIRTEGVTFAVDCDAVWSTVDIGTYVDLASASTLDIDAPSGDNLFYVEKGIGTAESGTVVHGQFTHGAPQS